MTDQLTPPRPSSPPLPRVRVDGKFFRLGDAKFSVKGVAYGPFQTGPDGESFPSPATVEADFKKIISLQANVVRVYTVPPRWLLDAAHRAGLKLFIDIPWSKNRCFLDSIKQKHAAREAVRAG
ncbi:MAG TPA: glycosyl transferase, partial [Verrucomicrobiae bacterium]|nr:glycosyl transferase [Verrucomicrobiae bacterium]